MKSDKDDAPELTAEVRAKARPAKDMLPEDVIAAFKRGPGRPRAEKRKEHVSLRLDPDVLHYFRSSGPGWQARVNEVLAKEARRR